MKTPCFLTQKNSRSVASGKPDQREQCALLYAFAEKESRKPVKNLEKRNSQAGCRLPVALSVAVTVCGTLQILTGKRDDLCDASKKSRGDGLTTA
jgi:hypothetical protein